VPAAAAATIHEALADVRRRHPEARWTPVENLHVTLVFLGSTEPDRVTDVGGVLADVTRAYRSFDVETAGGGGTVDGRRGGVAWLRLGGPGARTLGRLARDLDARLDIPGKGRVHAPHVTVARRATPQLIADLTLGPVRFSIDRVALFRSYTGPGGVRYERLFEAEVRE
jgi:2'-5' RNA ligase